MAARIKKGDRVVVIAGRDKGKTGEVEQVIPKENRAVVGGVNMAIRHTKQSQTNPQGGRIPKALPIDLSNLAVADKNGKPTRVGFRILEDGRKVRFAKTTGDVIDA
jgi:large subunit ribosomal protein L24